MAVNRTQTSIAAQMLAERIPMAAYGYKINPALALRIPRPVVPWKVNAGKKVSNG